MSFPFLQRMLVPNRPNQPVEKSLPALPTAMPVDLASATKRSNPFMIAMNQDSPEFREAYGVNRPLKKPMFLGYRDNKALYGGARLFILY